MIRKELFPVRNIQAEEKLKILIIEIEQMLGNPAMTDSIEEKLEQAKKFITVPGRIIDLDVIEQYYSWTTLDGLVRELTMEIPVNTVLSKDELSELLTYLRENLINGIPDEDTEYKIQFYTDFFDENYPDYEDVFDMLYDEIISVDDIVNLLTMES